MILKHKILIVFDDMIADILSNKKCNSIVTDLFIRGQNLNISLVFITKFLFCYTKKCYAKFYTLFYYENCKQTRTSTNFN